MKRFLTYFSTFVLPILAYLAVLEIVTARIPNSYSYKYNYVKTHGADILAVAVGPSHLYDAFKPDLFWLSPAFNLCNSSQWPHEDHYVLRELLPYMPNLKMVILEMGYYNVGTEESDTELRFSYRSRFYHKYMNIDYDRHLPLKYLCECFDPLSAYKKINNYYVKHADMVRCDSLGCRTLHSTRKVLGYKLFESNTLKTNDYEKYRIIFEPFLLKTIDMLMERNIAIVLISPPFYWNGFRANEKQRAFLRDYLETLCKEYPNIQYLDYESDSCFIAEDFYNETHLEKSGAEKLTRMLNRDIDRKCIKTIIGQ